MHDHAHLSFAVVIVTLPHTVTHPVWRRTKWSA